MICINNVAVTFVPALIKKCGKPYRRSGDGWVAI
jgi:hypothetical protein